MAVRIRLTRTGRKNLPSFRIAAFDGRTRRDGPALEVLGWYNPLSRESGKGFRVDAERLAAWLEKGALMTMPVTQLLKRQGVEVPGAKKGAPKKAAKKKAPAKKAKRPDPARAKKKKEKRATRKAHLAKKAAAKAASGKKE